MNESRIKPGFLVIVSVFFFWGFVAASNGILIPLFKYKFELTQFQSQLVDLAFYLAYAVGAVAYFILSAWKGDPLLRIGYKKGLIIGLLISALGALFFIPAANASSYFLLLCALFIIGLGFALQQIVANPFVARFGDPRFGSHRLNLAGGVNSFGTTIGPVLLSLALFGTTSAPKPESMGLESVHTPALVLFALFALCAMLISVSKLPALDKEEKQDKGFRILQYPQLFYGMMAIFLYVGVEVSIQSNLAALLVLPEIKGIDHTKIAPYISLFWGSLMIGRWTGSLTVFRMRNPWRTIMQIAVPLIAFGVILLINYISGYDVSDFKYYIPFVLFAILLFIISGEDAAKTLMILAASATILMLTGLFSSGTFALLCFISGGLFCSVMWPCIFSLSITGLGANTNRASSLLIMMILGGALIPPLQGYIADQAGPHFSYIVAVFCFAYLTWYGFRVRHFLRMQGIAQEPAGAGAH